MLKGKKLNFLFIIFVLIVLQLIFSNNQYHSLVYLMNISQNELFADWNVIISAIKCKISGFDVFLENPCDKYRRTHVYGSIFLKIPFFEKYSNFYLIYFPYTIISVYICIIILHFNLKNTIELILCTLFIFSPPTLLAIERFNNDILVFILLITACYSRSNFTNFLLISFATMAKFYPIVSSIILILRGKNFNRFFYFFLFWVSIIIFFYYELNNIKKIFLMKDQFIGSWGMSFSINNIFVLSSPLQISISRINLIIFTLIVAFFLIFIFFSKTKKIKIFQSYDFNNYQNRLFFVGLIICVLNYFVFTNYFYREIFLFFVYPFLITNKNNNTLIRNILYFIIGRHIFFFISNYLYLTVSVKSYPVFSKINYLVSIKPLLDLFLICALSGILLRICANLLEKIIKEKKNEVN